MFSVLRWCFTTCGLFMLCARRFYVHTSFPYKLSNLSPIKWATNVLKDEVRTTSGLENTEPGFDFTDDEMKKLKLWPGGVIPYYIDELSFDKVFRDRIRTFLDVTNGIAGVNFLELHRPPDDEKTRWLFFINRQGLLGCADYPIKNFTTQGVQKVVLGYECLTTGGELAEAVLAVLGVPPQHNAPNRLEHIHIVEENILPGKSYLFEMLKNDEWLFHDVDYDFSSAGHYPLHKHTANGKATIEPVGELKVAVGEGVGFSYTDVWKIRMLYNYISKKRNKAANVPECNKLFNVGTNFSKFKTESEDDIQPRKKPRKYFGLLEDSPEQAVSSLDDDLNINETETTKPNPNNEDIIESTEQEKMLDSKEDNSENKEPDKIAKAQKTYGQDLLMELTDYKTDEEYEKMKLKFTRPGSIKRHA